MGMDPFIRIHQSHIEGLELLPSCFLELVSFPILFSLFISAPLCRLPSTLEIVIPASAVGKVMGKGGTNLENIRRVRYFLAYYHLTLAKCYFVFFLWELHYPFWSRMNDSIANRNAKARKFNISKEVLTKWMTLKRKTHTQINLLFSKFCQLASNALNILEANPRTLDSLRN